MKLSGMGPVQLNADDPHDLDGAFARLRSEKAVAQPISTDVSQDEVSNSEQETKEGLRRFLEFVGGTKRKKSKDKRSMGIARYRRVIEFESEEDGAGVSFSQLI